MPFPTPPEHDQRRSWLRVFVRLTWIGGCVSILIAITLIGSQYLSNRRLMTKTRQTHAEERNPIVGWKRRWSIGLERWIGVDADIALFFRPTELLIQDPETTDQQIVEVLQGSSGLEKILIYNRDLPSGALQAIADRHQPDQIHIRMPVISSDDANLLSRIKSLKFVTIGQFERQPRENDWSWLKNLPALETLDVTLWGATQSDVIALAQSPAIRNVSLSGEGVTDETLSQFSSASQLQIFDLEGSKVCLHLPDGVKLPSSLKELELRWTAIDDQSQAAIIRLTGLQRVSIYGGKLTNVDFAAQLPGLKQLWLNNLADMTDDGLKSLKQNQSLTEILIESCGTTPHALIQLNAIPNWTEIRFNGVSFRRSLGGAKEEITPENVDAIFARQRDTQRLENEAINQTGPRMIPE